MWSKPLGDSAVRPFYMIFKTIQSPQKGKMGHVSSRWESEMITSSLISWLNNPTLFQILTSICFWSDSIPSPHVVYQRSCISTILFHNLNAKQHQTFNDIHDSFLFLFFLNDLIDWSPNQLEVFLTSSLVSLSFYFYFFLALPSMNIYIYILKIRNGGWNNLFCFCNAWFFWYLKCESGYKKRTKSQKKKWIMSLCSSG